jgi:4-hydroxymandelate oxidase
VRSGRFVDSLEEHASTLLPEPVFRYVQQGARAGVTAAEATRAWDRFRLLPSVMRDVTEVDTATSLLGTDATTPFAVAPTTMQRALNADGEVAMARGVAEAGSLMVVSSNAGSTFEDIAATGVTWWLQMYVTAERESCLPLLERAVGLGARAVVLTVDTPVVGTKYDGTGPTVWDIARPGWVRANFPAGHGSSAGDEKATDLGPQDVEWLAQRTGLTVAVKGVLRPQDARRCLDAGATAVWVSNHGGRQLDHTQSTIEALPPIADAVAGRAEIVVDGGFNRGTDVIKALARGARVVACGRTMLWGLAADGAAGVARVCEIMRDELSINMGLCGRTKLAELTPDLIFRAD